MRTAPLVAVLLAVTLALAGCSSMPADSRARSGDAEVAYVHRGAVVPTVVFQSGLGDGKSVWAAVFNRMNTSESAFAYDRPGYGSSPWVVAPRDPCTIAAELRTALHDAGLNPPYILVGHSIGGLYQFAYAKLFPEEVAGLLLLDPTHPEHWPAMQQKAPGAAAVVSTLRRTVFTGAMRKEFDDQGMCIDRLQPQTPLKAPVRMIVRSRFDLVELGAFQAMVRDLEQQWQVLLPTLSRREAENAGHYIQKDRPDIVVQELQHLRSEASKEVPQ